MSTSRTLALQLCLIGSAVIHLMPLLGLPGGAQLQQLYGLSDIDAATELLLRHRAVVFGLMAAMLLLAIRWQGWRMPAIALVLCSDLAFAGLVLSTQTPLPGLSRVMQFDLVSIVLLVTAAALIGLRRAPA